MLDAAHPIFNSMFDSYSLFALFVFFFKQQIARLVKLDGRYHGYHAIIIKAVSENNSSILTNQGHPTSVFGKYMFGRPFEI